jgi:hypothetical protein
MLALRSRVFDNRDYQVNSVFIILNLLSNI